MAMSVEGERTRGTIQMILFLSLALQDGQARVLSIEAVQVK